MSEDELYPLIDRWIGIGFNGPYRVTKQSIRACVGTDCTSCWNVLRQATGRCNVERIGDEFHILNVRGGEPICCRERVIPVVSGHVPAPNAVLSCNVNVVVGNSEALDIV